MFVFPVNHYISFCERIKSTLLFGAYNWKESCGSCLWLRRRNCCRWNSVLVLRGDPKKKKHWRTGKSGQNILPVFPLFYFTGSTSCVQYLFGSISFPIYGATRAIVRRYPVGVSPRLRTCSPR